MPSRNIIDVDALYFEICSKKMVSVDFLKCPRLDWDDRKIEYHVAQEIYQRETSAKFGAVGEVLGPGVDEYAAQA